MKTPYFTLSKAKRLISTNPKLLTNSQLQKQLVKARDYQKYTNFVDVYGKILNDGGYFIPVVDPSASGFIPKDIWLSFNLGFILDKLIQEKNKRQKGGGK